MAGRSQLGWAVPAADWEEFLGYVDQEWGSRGPNVRFELERAMAEFIDRDGDLADTEALLRDALEVRALSSSTVSVPSRDVDPENKRKVGYRVRESLKEEFTDFVDTRLNGDSATNGEGSTSHTTYSEALRAAINAYRDGGTSRRVRDLAEAVVSGSTDAGRDGGSIENGLPDETASVSTESESSTTPDPDVEAALVLEIAEDLPDQFPTDLLRKKTVARLQSEYDELPERRLEAYTDAVLNSLDVVEHPVKEGVYIPEEDRENYTVFSDLEREEKEVYLRRILVAEALEDGRLKHAVGYKEVMDLFDQYLHERPSTQHAYDLMEDSALASPAFSYGKRRGASRKQLQVDLTEVHDQTLAGAVELRMDLSQEDIADVLGPIVADSDTPRAATDGGVPLPSAAKD